jgi:hypothetical protein
MMSSWPSLTEFINYREKSVYSCDRFTLYNAITSILTELSQITTDPPKIR